MITSIRRLLVFTSHKVIAFNHQLNDLVTLVRGNLSKLARMILGALIVIEVRLRVVFSPPFQIVCVCPFFPLTISHEKPVLELSRK